MYNDEFLKNLSYELNTQDTDDNADPVFWMIRDYKDISNADWRNPEFEDLINIIKEYK